MKIPTRQDQLPTQTPQQQGLSKEVEQNIRNKYFGGSNSVSNSASGTSSDSVSELTASQTSDNAVETKEKLDKDTEQNIRSKYFGGSSSSAPSVNVQNQKPTELGESKFLGPMLMEHVVPKVKEGVVDLVKGRIKAAKHVVSINPDTAETEPSGPWASLLYSIKSLADIAGATGDPFAQARFQKQLAQVPNEQRVEAVKKAFSGFGELASDFITLFAAGTPGGSTDVSPELQERAQNLVEHTGPALAESVKGGLPSKKTFSSVDNFINTGPIGAVGHLLNGAVGQPAHAVIGTLGVNTDKNFNSSPLSVDEQAAAIKETVALVVTAGVAKGLHVGFSGKGTLPARWAKGAVNGGVSGVTFGTISQAGTPEELSAGAISGMLFAPFGALVEGVFGEGSHLATQAELRARANAQMLEQIRQLHMDGNASIVEATAKVFGVVTADDIGEAIIRGNLTFKGPQARVITGIKDGATLAKAYQESNVKLFIRKNERGTFDILIPGEHPVDVNMWTRTGFFENQKVALNGKDYTVIGEPLRVTEDPMIRLRDESGNVIEARSAHVRVKYGENFRSTTNSPYKGTGYRAVIIDRNPLEPGYHDAVHLALTPDHAAKFGGDNATLNRISYAFDNPLLLDEPNLVDLNSINSKTIADARAAGHDAIFAKVKDGRTEVIALDPAKLRLDATIAKNEITQSALNYYKTVIKPRLDKGGITIEGILAGKVSDAEMRARLASGKGILTADDMRSRAILSPERKKALLEIHDLLSADKNFDSTIEIAKTNGLTLEQDGVAYVLRDAETGTEFGRFQNPDAALQVINKIGQADGPPLTPDLAMDANGGLIGGDVAKKPWLETWTPQGMGRMERFGANLSSSMIGPFLQVKRAFIVNIDKLHNTQFFKNVYQPIQNQLLKYYVALHGSRTDLAAINKFLAGKPVERRSVISRWRETMSPQEVIDGYMTHRKMTPREVQYAKVMAGEDGSEPVNLRSIFKVRRRIRQIHQTYDRLVSEHQNNPDFIQQLNNERAQQLADALNDDYLTPKEARVVKDFEMFAAAENPDEFAIGPIVRLTQSYLNGEVSRSEFARANKMDAVELRVGDMVDRFYQRHADTFGIPDHKRLAQYMNHYREFGELPQFSNKDVNLQFASRLTRTGEVFDYIQDPVEAAIAYIQQGYKDLYLRELIAESKRRVVSEMQFVPEHMKARVAKVLNEYINDAAGQMNPEVAADEIVYRDMMQSLGINVKKKLSTDIVNGLQALVSSSMLGNRQELALRDMGTWQTIYYTRFGSKRALDAFRFAFETDEHGVTMADRLAAEGVNPNLSAIEIFSAEELAALDGRNRDPSVINRAANKFLRGAAKAGDIGITMSLQKNFYGKIHAGAYLESRRLALSELLELARGNKTKAQAYEALDMHSYDGPVAKVFDDLVTDGKFTDAADYLGRVTAIETAFIHGMANHPYGWGTNLGRVLTQYGMWSMWARNFLYRALSRGTKEQRAKALARFTASQAALMVAGRATGFRTGSWQMLPGLVFKGGPLAQVAATAVNLSGSSGSMQQKDAIQQISYNIANGRNMFVVGSYSFHDYLKALELNKRDFNLLAVFGTGIGFSVDETKRSFVDDWFSSNPQLKNPPVGSYEYLKSRAEYISDHNMWNQFR